jgi:hypothetical protein
MEMQTIFQRFCLAAAPLPLRHPDIKGQILVALRWYQMRMAVDLVRDGISPVIPQRRYQVDGDRIM